MKKKILAGIGVIIMAAGGFVSAAEATGNPCKSKPWKCPVTVTETIITTVTERETVTVTTPGETVTVTTPGETVTLPGETVTTPGETVTTPGETVTLPGETVTTPGKVVTVRKTSDGRTVTTNTQRTPTGDLPYTGGTESPVPWWAWALIAVLLISGGVYLFRLDAKNN